jgi:leucyl aminopeptidase (aminopeptidase T)
MAEPLEVHPHQPKSIQAGVESMLRSNMGLQPGERLLVVTDVPAERDWMTLPAGELQEVLERAQLARQVADIASLSFPQSNVEFTVFPCTRLHGSEIPTDTADRMAAAQVVVAITTYSLTHTNARLRAVEAGARFASMPGFEAAMFAPGGPMEADPLLIASRVRLFADLLDGAGQVHLFTPGGTDLRFRLEGRPGLVDDGMLNRRSTWGNLPAGEAYIVPLEGTAQGKLVVPAGWYPGLDAELVFSFREGKVSALNGGGQLHALLEQWFQPGSDDPLYTRRRNLAELGIGCNHQAHNPQNVLEAEKILGTVHLGIGDNLHMGGLVESDLHEDFLQPGVDLTLDGRLVIQGGRWLVDVTG